MLKQSGGDEVVAADSDHTAQLVGAVVGSKDATLSLSRATDRVQIATSGGVDVIVSDLGGTIKSGDSITASPLSGVGMKATESGRVVGVARGEFTAKQATKTTTLKSNDGTTRTFSIGTVPVDIQVTYFAAPSAKTIIPAFLQKFTNTIAGKEVSVFRVVLGMLIAVASVFVVTILLFVGVRSSMTSIGRNPLAQSDIYRGLLQVLLTGVGILGLSFTLVYIILTH